MSVWQPKPSWFRSGRAIAVAIALLFSGTALVFSQQETEVKPDKAASKKPENSQQDKKVTASQQDTASERISVSYKGGARWGADYFPNVPLTTHTGKRVRFFDDLVKDKVVVINFMYASCTDSCPMGTARLTKIYEMLGDRVGKDIFMYSISIDPERDTPEVLREYKKMYNIDEGWTFLTGKKEDIMHLRDKLGVYINIASDGPLNHNMSLVMGNQRTGQWIRRSPMDNPYFLARQIGGWLTNWRAAGDANENSYAQAPQMAVPTMGQNLYRSRCISCHTIGGGDRRQAKQHRIGPDLLNVTQRRDREWLVRWIKNPERMLAEEDPVALRLYEQYNNIIMPNLRLNETEANALIDYIKEESRRVSKQLADAGSHEGHDHHKHHDHHNHQH